MGKGGERSTGGRRKTWTLGWGDFEALVSETLFLDVRGNVEANEENLDCLLAVAHEIKTQRPLTHKDALHSTDTGKSGFFLVRPRKNSRTSKLKKSETQE